MQLSTNQIKIAVSTSRGTCFFSPCEIVRLEASSSYTNNYFINKTRLVSSKVLKQFAQVLEPLDLPNIPAAAVVEREGILLGDMQKRMMEKIEELTLYLIEANKQIKELNKKVSKMEQVK